MKHNLIHSLFPLFALIILTACNSADGVETTVGSANQDIETSVQVDIGTDTEVTAVVDCPEATSDTHLLVDNAHGICFLYPNSYDAYQSMGGGFTLYKGSLLNTEAPSVSVAFESAGGRSLQEVTDQRLSDYASTDTQPESLNLGGDEAMMLDNLPGQDINRRIFTIHNDLVVDLVTARIGAEYGAVGEEAERVYEMITGSLQFIPVLTDAPLRAGPECPEPVPDSTQYTNEIVGYCLLLPAGYEILEVSSKATDNELVFYVDSVQDTSHARLSVKATDAKGRTLDEITAAYETEIEKAVPGYDVMWSFGYMLDGEPAN